MVGSKVFRRVSLERLSSPEQLDLLMRVTSPKSWLALLGIGGLLTAVILWGFLGQIPIEVNAPAIILPTGGIKSVISLSGGQLTELTIAPGDVVEAEQLIGYVTPIGQTTAVPITSPFNGRVIELKTGLGHLIDPGATIASLEPIGDANQLQAILYVSQAEANQLQPNMIVKLAPSSVQVEEYGYLLGEITAIGEFPVSDQGILTRIGNQDLAAITQAINSPIEVTVTFLQDDTVSGFEWTTSSGPNYGIGSGTTGSAIIVIDQKRPFNLFLAR